MAGLPLKSLLAILPFFLQASAAGLSGSAITTRYWDCCKPACAWPDAVTAAQLSNPVAACSMNDNPLTDPNAQSGCNGGPAFACADQTPWAVSSSLSYGFAAFNSPSGSTKGTCCACFELTFTSGPVSGKKMIVQATNIGYDLNSNQFDIAMPGGGVGAFNGCQTQYGTSWGSQYGGISSAAQCATLLARLQPGCNWRFGWFGGADNPAATFEQVACPAALTARTGCVRADDGISETPTGPAVVPTWVAGSAAASSSSSAAASSSVSKQSTSSTSSTSPPPPASSTPSTGTGGAVAPHWGQCGGNNWPGPYACVSGTTCQVQNAWYSQCL